MDLLLDCSRHPAWYISRRTIVGDASCPCSAAGMPPFLSFNTAVSFVTGTNWQAYEGETQASYFADTVGLVVAQFTAAGIGLAVALAVLRGIAACSLFTALLLMAANIRKIRAWRALTTPGQARSTRRAPRRRTSLRDYLPDG